VRVEAAAQHDYPVPPVNALKAVRSGRLYRYQFLATTNETETSSGLYVIVSTVRDDKLFAVTRCYHQNRK